MARKFSKRVYAIVGRAREDRKVRELFDGVYALAERGIKAVTAEEALADAVLIRPVLINALGHSLMLRSHVGCLA